MSALRWVLVAVVVAFVAVGLWSLVGFYPQRAYPDLQQAGLYGDSFGFVNSLFSSFGFALVIVAIVLQMKELHEATKTQDIQGKLQLQQTEIAERTARIQESIRLDSHRKLAMDAFLKIDRDALSFKHAFLAWHPENNKPTHSQVLDQDRERQLKKDYFDAYTALRSNCQSIGLIFDRRGDTLGQAVQEMYLIAQRWIEMRPRHPSAVECESALNAQIEQIEQSMRLLWRGMAPSDK